MATQYTAGLTAGQVLTAATMNQIGAAWETYTPTWTANTANPVLGNGTIVGYYTRIQKLVVFQVRLITGSTTTYGTGVYFFSLPVTASAASGTINTPLGSAWAYDVSLTTGYTGVVIANTTTRVAFQQNAGQAWGVTVPFTWAAGDNFYAQGCYEAA